MAYYVYILASQRNGTLYVGVTNDLVRRAWEHREGAAEGFTKRYGVNRLVYYEEFEDVRHALQREKNIKHWPRAWKLALIEKDNPDWLDLYEKLNT
jgi:putative endonuclease